MYTNGLKLLNCFAGLHDLRREVNADNSRTPINQLCKTENQQVVFLCLKSAFPLDEILFKFDTMFRNYSTTLFGEIWKHHMKTAYVTASQAATALVIDDIKTKIWDPTFVECGNLLSTIKNCSIKLIAVDHYFRRIENRKMQLIRLHNGVLKCSHAEELKTRSNIEWIDTAIYLMKEYWSLLDLADAARTIMTLKTKLKLSGDFTLVDSIVKKVKSFI